jgi:aminoglycoside phosphotransferase family enzyme/predicted kinase
MTEATDQRVIQAMRNPGFYDHPVERVELIETHISLIFLAGDFAYKVKKPVNFGFLDFSTLAKRRHYCHEELRLNRRFAPRLYLAVKRIGGSRDAPGLDRQPALEYAVKMRRFPQDRQLDRMLAAGRLEARHIKAFAAQIAELHHRALPVSADQPYGSPGSIIAPMLENFAQLGPLLHASASGQQLARLEQWTQHAFAALQETLRQRKTDGFIRECHGDAHLANMAWFDDQPLLFDCIEFNENLRWIDVINDIAFLVMDLDDRGETGLGWEFLNHYLQETGDYRGLTLLNFYRVYRAMVRAKVTGLRLDQGHLDEGRRRQTAQLLQSYLDLAERYTVPQATPLIITHGFSGAGKTTFARQLATVHGAIHLRSDVERKRLHGLPATAKSGSPVGGGIYSAQAFAGSYTRLRDSADTLLRSGYPVIVDATFIKRQQRQLFSRLARQLQVPLLILDFPLADQELRRRIRARQAGTDASEATVAVLDYQLEQHEPLSAAEQQRALRVQPDTGAEEISARLRTRADPGHSATP